MQASRTKHHGRQYATKPVSRAPNPSKIFVGNISYRITRMELEEFFSQFGEVAFAQIVRDRRKGWSRGIGFVTFKTAESAQLALSATDDMLTLDERMMRVSLPLKPKRQKAMEDSEACLNETIHGGESMVEGSVGESMESMDERISEDSSVKESGALLENGEFPLQKAPTLTNDALFHIFSYLHFKDIIRSERVCKQWQRISLKWWKSVKKLSFENTFVPFKGKYGGLTDDILLSIFKRGCLELRSLDLSASPRFLTDFSVDLISMYCSKLERLDISGMSVTQSSFRLLAKRCNRLKWLRLSGCFQIGEKCLWWGFHYWTDLEYLNLSGNRRITGQCFFKAGDKLHTVIINNSDSITDAGLAYLTQKAKALQVLDVSHCSMLTGVIIRSVCEVRSIPEIDFIEEEYKTRGAQIPWHLDRIDQRQLPLDKSYQPIGTGEGVDIYILDSGINYDHEEFENRVKYPNYDPVDEDLDENQQGFDCHGHGTHVASLAGGKTVGAAKKATIFSVRVLDCTNSGTWTGLLNGMDFVARRIEEKKRPAIVSMSLSGPHSQTVINAVEELHSEGIIMFAAAGNDFIDACSRTPASSPYLITVGGSSNGDGIYFVTNFGQCVDIYAPGSRVLGADHRCETCTKFLSGTSMSTPLVSGIAAIHLQREPLLTPDEMKRRLVDTAVANTLDFGSIPLTHRSNTANRHLSIVGSCGGVLTASVTPSTIQSPNYPSNYPTNLHCKWTISTTPGNAIRVDIVEMITEDDYDTVKICDGLCCESGGTLAILSGQIASNTFYRSNSNVLTVEMETDSTTGARGFRVSYDSVSGGTVVIPTLVPPTPPPSTFLPTLPPSSTESPPAIVDSCDLNDQINQQLPLLLSGIIEEASVTLQNMISQTFNQLLQTRILGQLQSYPADNCMQLADVRSSNNLESGYFWIKAGNGTTIRVYCDFTSAFSSTAEPGWMRIANLNMTDPKEDCPTSLSLKTGATKRTCGRGQEPPGCSSVFYQTHGLPYQKVCGLVIGYQFSSTNAFFAYGYDNAVTLDEYYVDGVSITHSSSPRKHVWTFAAARDEISSDNHICPCTNSAGSNSGSPVPPYVGQNYFCDTGSRTDYEEGVFYENDPLWNGNGCGQRSTCCRFNNPPYFCTDLGEAVTDDIELRICGNEDASSEDTPMEMVQLYNCARLRELYFAGPNANVKTSDLRGLSALDSIEVLVLDQQIACNDEVLTLLGRNCVKLRKLSCEACHNITDNGVACLITCTQLTDLNLSYCHHVTDGSMVMLAGLGVLQRLILRACHSITDRALCQLAEKCMNLHELDICGCLGLTNRVLYAFQESLLHMREAEHKKFVITLGGTEITGEVAMQFASDTGATMSLHDLTTQSLLANYDPFYAIPPLNEECWEDDHEPPTIVNPTSFLESEPMVGQLSSYYMEKAEDFLIADDPALYSDEFSDSEDWGLYH